MTVVINSPQVSRLVFRFYLLRSFVCLTLLVFAILPTAAQTSVILTGQVTDSLTGEPLPAAAITLTDASGATWESIADEHGIYTFTAVPAGEYRISVDLRGYKLPEIIRITLDPTATTLTQDLMLFGMTTIVGQVFDADGVTPLANLPVLARGTEANHFFAAVTDADGFYTFNEMEPDAYQVSPLSLDYVFEARDAGIISRGTPIFGFDFVAVAYSSISGTVLDIEGAPVTDAVVSVTRADDETFYGLTDANGAYVIAQITGTGVFSVQAYAESAEFPEIEVEITAANTVLTGVDLQALPAETEFVAPATTGSGVIYGRVVTTETGEPLPGIVITIALITGQAEDGSPELYPLFIDEQPIVTDANGEFVIRDLAPGRYQLIAERPGALDELLAAGEIADEATFTAALDRVLSSIEVEVTAEGATPAELTLAS